jgi:hypothetical protein
MKKKQVLACILVSLLVMMAVPAVLAHTHIELPNDGCQNVPGADTDQDTGSHFGMGVAKGSDWGSRSEPPGNSDLDDYPGNADAAPLEGGWCD